MNRFLQGLIIGVLLGMLVGGGAVYAAQRATLVDGTSTEVGTTTNPIYVNGV